MRTCFSDDTYICCIESMQELRAAMSGISGGLCPPTGGDDIGSVTLRIGDEARVERRNGRHEITIPRAKMERLYDQMTRIVIMEADGKYIVVQKSYTV